MLELVIGGSGSGKSAYAEQHICRLRRMLSRRLGGEVPLYYIAAMIPRGEETENKIESHRNSRRGKGFETLEWHMDICGRLKEYPLPENSCVLLECLSNLTANELYETGGAKERTADKVTEGIRMLQKQCAAVVVVTNQVFCEPQACVQGQQDEMSRYKGILGEINSRIAAEAEQVTEVVMGIPSGVKGGGRLHLVTGGAFQGKYAWALSAYPGMDWADGAVCPLDKAGIYGGMNHFHTFIRRWLESGRLREELTDLILEQQGETVLVGDEIGCGLVPVDAFERKYREETGRIYTELAAAAVRVERIVCGIPQRLK